MIKEWKDQGCDYCRDHWFAYDGRLILLVDSIALQARLYQCPKCRCYWEESQRYAREISTDEARRNYSL